MSDFCRRIEIPDQELTCDEALEILKEMNHSGREFDRDLVVRIDDLLRGQADGQASPELVKGLLDVQRLLFLNLAARDAVPASSKAVRWAKALGDRPLLAKTLQYRGTMASNIGDLSTAFESTLEALKIGYETRNAERVAACYLNLGNVMQRTGRHRAALACTEASINWYRKTGDVEPLAHALNALADQHIKARNWGTAWDVLRQARLGFEGDVSGEHHFAMNCADYAGILMNEVTTLVHLGESEAALDVVHRLASVSKRYSSERINAYLRFAEAVYAGFVNDTDEAVKALSRFRDVPEMRDEALGYLASIHERRGEPEKALEITRELLEGLRAARREITTTDLSHLDVSAPGGDDEVIRNLISRAAGFERVVERIGDKFKAKLAYLFELAVNAELREEGGERVGEHIYRVGRLSAALATEAGCADEMCWLAEVAGRAHDVGKTSVPSITILKTEPLTEGEIKLLQSHAQDGAALIAQLAEPRLVQVVAAVRHHHECWDGAGYPTKLRGEEIPLLARIVAICDSFDAMTNVRAFRRARSVTSGLAEIERCAGSQFEPGLAGLFTNLVRRLQREHGNLDEYLGEMGRRTRWAKSHPELMRLLDEAA